MKWAIPIVLLLAVPSGCGGGHGRLSKAEYQAKLRSAFSTANAELGPAPHVAGSPTLLKRIATSFGGVASSLKDARPPANVQALNEELVAGAARQAAVLNTLVVKLERAPKIIRERLLAQFDATQIAGQHEFDQAVAGLVAKGYRFKPSAGT